MVFQKKKMEYFHLIPKIVVLNVFHDVLDIILLFEFDNNLHC